MFYFYLDDGLFPILFRFILVGLWQNEPDKSVGSLLAWQSALWKPDHLSITFSSHPEVLTCEYVWKSCHFLGDLSEIRMLADHPGGNFRGKLEIVIVRDLQSLSGLQGLASSDLSLPPLS